jgi:hypothetical protein
MAPNLATSHRSIENDGSNVEQDAGRIRDLWERFDFSCTTRQRSALEAQANEKFGSPLTFALNTRLKIKPIWSVSSSATQTMLSLAKQRDLDTRNRPGSGSFQTFQEVCRFGSRRIVTSALTFVHCNGKLSSR